jgi:hypothetical protein
MNFIEVYPNAIPDELCDRLITLVDTHKGGYAGRTGAGVDRSKKHSYDLMLDEHAELSPIRNELLNHTFPKIADYFDKYALALVGAIAVNVEDDNGNSITLTPDNYAQLGKPQLHDIVKYLYRSGTINIQKYAQDRGGYPHWHSEQFPQADHNEALHRVILYMYYLNDVAEGGETEFYYQQEKISPTKGTMVVAPAGFTHSHRGNTPLSSDKYIATSWILFHRSEKLFG